MLSTQPVKSYTANIATAFSTPSASAIPEASNDAHGPSEVKFAEMESYRPGIGAKIAASSRTVALESRAALDDGDRLAALL